MPNHHAAIAVMALLLTFHPCPAWSADPPPIGFATTLRYADFGPLGTARKVLTDRAGNAIVVGVIVNRPVSLSDPAGRPDTSIAVIKLDNTGHVVFRFVFGGTGYNDPRGAAMDAAGSVYIGGVTAADDFPLVNALISQTLPKEDAGFISKVDATGSRLLFSTRLSGGTAVLFPDWPLGAEVNALALDGQSDIYITGDISHVPMLPAGEIAVSQTNAFVVKMSSTGDRVMYSTLLGGTRNCGDACMYLPFYSAGVAIAVDSSGQATFAGSTNTGVQVTPGAFQTQCQVTVPYPPHVVSTGFVSRLNATGTTLVWSTCLGGGPSATSFVTSGGGVSAIALDDAGNVFVGGATGAANFPVTPGVLGPTAPGGPFAAKLDTTGTELLYSTFLAVGAVTAITADSQGHAWVTSPAVPNSSGNDLFVELETDASRLLQSYRLPVGSVGQEVIAVSPTNVLTLGSSGEVLDWFFGDTSAPSLVGFTNAAATTASRRVAPGEFVSIYGVGLGPTPGLGPRLDADGGVATSLAGVQVLFDGRPAPLVYVSDTQINLIAPFEIAGNSSTTVQVVTASGSSPTLNLMVVEADPGLFRTPAGDVAALNQDGTINSRNNPAQSGSVIALYANGFGLLDPLPADGSVTGTVLAKPVLPVSVAPPDAEILYAGAAPGLVAGVLQINVRIPAFDNPLQQVFGLNFRLNIGSESTEGLIYIR